MSKTYFEAEYYYHSRNAEQAATLRLLEACVETCKKDGVQIDLKATDCDSAYAEVPSDIPALPCLRRMSPAPERILIGPIRDEAEVRILLGIQGNGRARGAERFSGWTREQRD